MHFNKLWDRIPKLPLSALIFYILTYFLWQLEIIPPPAIIVEFLESLYKNYGLLGLFISSLLEGLVYIGLYFPGSFILALVVLVSESTISSLLTITAITTGATLITSCINYIAGRYLLRKQPRLPDYEKPFTKRIFLAIIHPNILAFYCFNHGIHKRSPFILFILPFLLFPYSFIIIGLISLFKEFFRSSIENPYIMFTAILVWIIGSFIINYQRKRA